MRVNKGAKILFTKSDIASMLSISRTVFRIACESLNVEGVDWRSRTQRFRDDQVFKIIKTLRNRLSDAEIDALIRKNAGF